MTWQPDKYQPLDDALRGGDVEPEVKEELEHHIAMRIEENLAAGMSREEAEAEARRRFGDVNRYREETRRVEQQNADRVRRRDRLAVAGHEVRRAWRALVRVPSFSGAAVATLAIGIGATAAMFAILNAVVLSPLPYPNADRLVRLYHPVPKNTDGERWNLSQAEYFHLQTASKQLDAIGVFGQGRLVVMADGKAVPVDAAIVTASMLDLLGATPRAGRLFTAAENERGAPMVALLAEDFWRTQYGSSPDAIGSKIRIEGNEATVIGVVAKGVDLPNGKAQLWLAMELDSKAEARNNHVYKAVARLAPGATMASASAELAAMVRTYPERFPSAYSTSFLERTGFTSEAVSWKADVIGDSNRVLWILFGAVAVVLLIAAFNVGNLFVVRGQLQRKEVVLRAALGADRGHLAWHHLAESGMICLSASLLGLGAASIGLGALVRSLSAADTRVSGPAVPRLAEISLGWESVAFALGLGLLATLVFGLGPLFAAPLANQVLRQGGRGLTQSRREARVRAGLVVAQITFAVVLLAAAGLMLRTFQNLRAVKPGFDPAGVMVLDVALPYGKYQDYPQTVAFHRRLIEQIKSIPAVRNASVATDVPVDASDGCSVFEYVDRPPNVDVTCILNAMVGPDFFTTLGVPLKGRDLTWDDLTQNTGATVVSDQLAKRLWPGAEALDRGVNGPNNKTDPPYRIVGVTQALRWRGLDREPVEIAFLPMAPIPKTYLWQPLQRSALVVKVSGVDGAAIVPSIRQFVKELEPEAAVSNYRSMDQVVTNSLLRIRVMMVLLVLASIAAMFLSAVGLYGVIAYLVNRRTQEIGIRIALGASARSVRRGVVGQSVRLAAVGVVLGTLGGLALTRSLGSMLYGVTPGDPLTLGFAAGILLLVAAAASLVPAARATRIDPIEALRAE